MTIWFSPNRKAINEMRLRCAAEDLPAVAIDGAIA